MISSKLSFHGMFYVLFVALVILSGCNKNEELVNEDYTIVLTQGNNQTGPINKELLTRIWVEVNDKNGNEISGISVKYIINGNVQKESTTAWGVSEFSWVLGSEVGEQKLTITAHDEEGKRIKGSPITVTATAVEHVDFKQSDIQGRWIFNVGGAVSEAEYDASGNKKSGAETLPTKLTIDSDGKVSGSYAINGGSGAMSWARKYTYTGNLKYTKDEMMGSGTNKYITVSSSNTSYFDWSANRLSN